MAGQLTLDLVGVTEIAEMFGMNRVTISKWRQKGILPDPDAELTKRPLWLRSTIEQWAAKTGRKLVA
jgi:predicted DNA-binding transcriptional regulator AlpA